MNASLTTGNRARAAILAVTAIAALWSATAAWAFPERKVSTGRYAFQEGKRTTSGAIFFDLRGTGTDKHVAALTYRNRCLTHNAKSPPIRLTRDGRIRRTYSHSQKTVLVSIEAEWVSATRVRGVLVVNEFGCESELRFDARLDERSR